MAMQDVDINAGYIRQVQHLSNLREKSYNADMVRETELLKLKIANLKNIMLMIQRIFWHSMRMMLILLRIFQIYRMFWLL